MSLETTVQPIEPAMTPHEDAARDAAALDMDMQIALTSANNLLAIALQTLSQASGNDDQNPEDVRQAQDTVLMAQQTVREIREIVQGQRRGDARAVSSKISTLNTAVVTISNEVEAHDGAVTGEATKRNARQAEVNESKKNAASKAGAAALYRPRTSAGSAIQRHADGEDDDSPTAIRARRHRGENDDNDTRDNEVGKGARRRERKATSSAGRQATRILSGVMAEDTADEIVSTAGTAVENTASGAVAIISGDREGSDKAALTQGRGVRNVLRDDLGLNEDVAQTLGRATTVTLTTAGRAGMALRDSAVDARDTAADLYEMTGKLGRELNDIRVQFQNNAALRKQFDTDRDGTVELHEIVDKLGTFGITDMRNIDFNGDGDITMLEVAAAIRSRGNPPAKQ